MLLHSSAGLLHSFRGIRIQRIPYTWDIYSNVHQHLPHRKTSTMKQEPTGSGFLLKPPYFTIQLNENEAKLAKLLVSCAQWVNGHPEEVDKLRLIDSEGNYIGKARGNEPIQLRIAGGWVRDKLMGEKSDDIDVSVSPDPLTGLKFAMLFEKYLEENGLRNLMGKLTKIEAKPEQSKHLETATATVCDLSVDWVQQRGSEVYSGDSRVPTVAFGTVLEDAERRDLTINALFYNLQTGLVEDQTQKGLADLGIYPLGSPKMIRTPLEPFQTFRDDPLRVIRAVRFAARFGSAFKLDEELVQAVSRKEIRAALADAKKISRERVGVELEKMLLGRDPVLAMELIRKLNLYPLVFLYDPESATPVDSSPVQATKFLQLDLSIDAARWIRQMAFTHAFKDSLHPLLQPRSFLDSHKSAPVENVEIGMPSEQSTTTNRCTLKRLFLSAALLPLYPYMTVEKKKPLWVGEKVVRDGLKWAGVDRIWVSKARDACSLLISCVKKYGMEELQIQSFTDQDRVEIGLLLRHPAVDDRNLTQWNVSLFWSLIVELTLLFENLKGEEVLTTLNRYNRFVELVLKYGLDKKAFEPPLIDGTRIIEILPQAKDSAAVNHILNLVIQYQLGHPGSGKEACEENLFRGDGRREVDKILSETSAAFTQSSSKLKLKGKGTGGRKNQ